MFYVYLLTYLPTGEQYVGMSKDPYTRFGQHLSTAKLKRTKIARRMRDTSPQDWTLKVLHESKHSDQIAELEMQEIIARDLVRNGLNTSMGLADYTAQYGTWHSGRRGIYSEETLKKMSDKKQGNTAAKDFHADPVRHAEWLITMKAMGKPVIEPATGKIFASIAEVAAEVGCGRCDVRRVCNGKRPHVKQRVFQWYTET